MSTNAQQDAVFAGGLSKTWRSWRHTVHALDNVTLRVPRGSAFGLLGPNGAGKTTFVKAIIGALRPTSGMASVFGHAAGSREALKLIGYVPESNALPLHLTAQQLLDLYATMHGIGSAERRRRIPAMLERIGLADRASTPLSKCSRGMKQRAAIAAALLHGPQLLILDEPTDGLDPAARRTVLELLRNLNREQSVTLLINSHLLNEVEELCDEVAMLRGGRLIRQVTVSSLMAETGYALTLSAVPEALEDLLRDRGMVMAADPGRPLYVTVQSREQLDWTLDQVRATGAVVESMGRSARVLENAYLSENQIATEMEYAL